MAKKQEKKGNFFIREIKSYKRYWMFRPSTPSLIGKKIGISDMKEIIKTYKSLEEPDISFERSMQVEGIIEKDLVKAHKIYNILMMIIITISLYPLYVLFDTINNKIDGVSFSLGFIPSLFPSIVSLMFLFFFYLNFSWLQWRIRNRKLALPSLFLRVALSYPSQLLPIHDIKDTMEKEYGEKWAKKIAKKR